MLTFGIFLSFTIILVALLGFIGNASNLVLLIVYLELILLSVGLLFVHYSFILDDLIGANISLILLPLAGAESAVALAMLVAYYPFKGN